MIAGMQINRCPLRQERPSCMHRSRSTGEVRFTCYNGDGDPFARARPTSPGAEPTAHHGFGDVAHWAGVFESPDRARWQKPDDVVQALDLKRGQMVIDIGAGTGYFARRFAKAVGAVRRSLRTRHRASHD